MKSSLHQKGKLLVIRKPVLYKLFRKEVRTTPEMIDLTGVVWFLLPFLLGMTYWSGEK